MTRARIAPPRRQRIRNLTLLLAFVLLPITQFYFSPYLIIDGAAQGVVSGSLLVFLLLLLGGLFVGRGFCGWVMPCGAFQELVARVRPKPVRPGLHRIKWVLWGVWLAAIVAVAIAAGGFRRIDVFHKIEGGISVSQPVMYIVYYAVLALLLIVSLAVGKRANCHVLCWMAPFMVIGRKAGKALRLPHLVLRANTPECISCGTCSRSCPMSLDVQDMVRRRNTEHPECIFCGVCADECPTSVLSIGVATRG